MPTYLVVANQTLGGERLMQELRSRIQRGDARFHVLVPVTRPEHYTATWTIEGTPMFEVGAAPSDLLEQARARSERSMRELLDRIRQEGGEAEGELGDPDPVTAVEQALETRDVDEIILSTLPAGVSRWLKLDLPSRLDRKVDVPVTLVEAEPRD